jgi:hypothetical protein
MCHSTSRRGIVAQLATRVRQQVVGRDKRRKTTVFAKSVCVFRCGRIHAKRRVVNLACSCSVEARLRRVDLIREPLRSTQDACSNG